MIPLPSNLLSTTNINADLVRHLHAEDPFFRARADRYGVLDDEIRSAELAIAPPAKYLRLLKQRREALLLELVDMITASAPSPPEKVWKIAPTPQPAPKTSPFSWP